MIQILCNWYNFEFISLFHAFPFFILTSRNCFKRFSRSCFVWLITLSKNKTRKQTWIACIFLFGTFRCIKIVHKRYNVATWAMEWQNLAYLLGSLESTNVDAIPNWEFYKGPIIIALFQTYHFLFHKLHNLFYRILVCIE